MGDIGCPKKPAKQGGYTISELQLTTGAVAVWYFPFER